ncbi:hypothetical protein P43SY_001790 [Pythium insidiosum]|uniref:Uncharacterized protein n=1 Tax=Pythium insidiosum TaxID=114742 RepID=A0AAD5LEN0_PYTIN|nr:hypothetical protein P43SY_001790 [Pythium insidiosum]
MSASPANATAAPSSSSTTNNNDKLSSLFNKKKKKGAGAKSMNANVLAKEPERAAAPTAKPAAATAPTKTKPAAATATATAAASTSPPSTAVSAAGKTLADLSLGDKKASAEETKKEFQWAKQPKKYKAGDKELVARTWEEQEERNRVARRINLQSERAFPTLGADATQAQLDAMKVKETKAVATRNVWATLGHGDEDDEDDEEDK